MAKLNIADELKEALGNWGMDNDSMQDYEGNLNNITKSGYVTTNSKTTNAPSSAAYYIITLCKSKTYHNLQIAIERDEKQPKIYMRVKSNGTAYSEWSNGVSLNDIVSYINCFKNSGAENYRYSDYGWCTFPNGIIIQWGIFTGSGTKTFPKVFPNNCLMVVSSPMGSSTSNPPYITISGVSYWNKSEFSAMTVGYMKTGDYGEDIMTQYYRGISAVTNFGGATRYIAIGY